jgi:hypothetical protein
MTDHDALTATEEAGGSPGGASVRASRQHTQRRRGHAPVRRLDRQDYDDDDDDDEDDDDDDGGGANGDDHGYADD